MGTLRISCLHVVLLGLNAAPVWGPKHFRRKNTCRIVCRREGLCRSGWISRHRMSLAKALQKRADCPAISLDL